MTNIDLELVNTKLTYSVYYNTVWSFNHHKSFNIDLTLSSIKLTGTQFSSYIASQNYADQK
jgi:hypothetical protein